jgi:hypothetical protein
MSRFTLRVDSGWRRLLYIDNTFNRLIISEYETPLPDNKNFNNDRRFFSGRPTLYPNKPPFVVTGIFTFVFPLGVFLDLFEVLIFFGFCEVFIYFVIN